MIDPNGIPQHAPGAKLDGGKVRMDLVLVGFPRALYEVGEIATYGAGKYTPNGWMSVPNGIDRYAGALLRHLVADATGEQLDHESGLRHLAHAAWNALAILELAILADDLPITYNPRAAHDLGLRLDLTPIPPPTTED